MEQRCAAGAVLMARADMPNPGFLLFMILPIPLSFPAPSDTESQRTPGRKPDYLSLVRLGQKRLSFHWGALKEVVLNI